MQSPTADKKNQKTLAKKMEVYFHLALTLPHTDRVILQLIKCNEIAGQ